MGIADRPDPAQVRHGLCRPAHGNPSTQGELAERVERLRWVSKYAEPWAATLSGLKDRLEQRMEKVFEIYIKTTPERLWEAITDPELRAKYSFGVGVHSDWSPGSRYESVHPGAGLTIAEGENVEVDPRAGWCRASRRSGAIT